MFLTLALIATGAMGFTLGLLVSWPFICRLRQRVIDTGQLLIHDRLTGLYNRDGLGRTREPQPASSPQTMILVLLDLDHFKGHQRHLGPRRRRRTSSSRWPNASAKSLQRFGGSSSPLVRRRIRRAATGRRRQRPQRVGQAFVARVAAADAVHSYGVTHSH